MSHRLILGIFVLAVLAGCARWTAAPSSEAALDSELAAAIPGSNAPEAGPAEPQRGFDQEQLQSQQI